MRSHDAGNLSGILIPTVTPFDHDGALDLTALERNLHRWGQSSVRGYMCLGSNGEFRSLSDDESLDVVRTVRELKGDKTLVVGVGRESLRLTLAFIAQVATVGDVDYVSVLTPHYFAAAMSDDTLIDYYRTVADNSPLPVLIYVAPRFANSVTLSPRAVLELAGHPNIRGIKDNTPALADYLPALDPGTDFAVLAGSLAILRSCLTLGGSGGVVSAANYLPQECAAVTEDHARGETELALTRLEELQRVVAATAGPHGVAGVKCCMDLLGLHGGLPRRPVPPATQEVRDAMRRALQTEGILR